MTDSADEELNVSEPQTGLSEDEIIKMLLSPSPIKLKDLVPSGPIKSKNAVKVANWILSSHSKKKSTRSVLHRIKWLTAIVQYGIVDSLKELEKLFNPLVQLIYVSQYQASICHLLFMIATPNLYKFQVERITKNANVVGLTKPLAGLLSRIKSLRPDLVPQTIPHQSNAISFPKAPISIRIGLYALSERIKENHELPNQVTFAVEDEGKRVTKKMRLDIVPLVQHINLKSSFEVDFRKMVHLSQFQTFEDLVKKITIVELPNHVGSLLSKGEYHYVLALNFTPHMEALLSQWLYLTLSHEFMEKSQLIGKEGKTLLLNRIIEFQKTTGLKLMVVYDFLSEYLNTCWDGIQFSDQIFHLLSEIPFLPYADIYENFLRILENLFNFCPTPNRLKIIDTCRKLIRNLMLQKFGPADQARLLFQNSSESMTPEQVTSLVEGIYVINEVIRFTERLFNTALTTSNDVSLILSSLLFHTWLIDLESEFQLPFRTFCQPITVYMALFTPAPATIALLLQLLCKYNELGRKQLMNMSPIPQLDEFLRDSLEDASLLNRYVIDTSSCLIYQKAFSAEGNSLLSRVPRKHLKMLAELGSYKQAFDLKRHLAFTGVARQWIKSKASDLLHFADEKNRLFEEIDADSTGYFKYLFGCFPAVTEYIRAFHDDEI